MVFYWIDDKSMIDVILKVAAYTYGPLLGLFTFGIITKRQVNDALVPVVCILAPVLCYIIERYQQYIFGDFQIGLELLIINGALTFLGLMLISKRAHPQIK